MKPKNPTTLGENVSRIVIMLLARDGMQRQEFALAVGWDTGTVSRALNGQQRKWLVDDLEALAQVFDVPVVCADLFT